MVKISKKIDVRKLRANVLKCKKLISTQHKVTFSGKLFSFQHFMFLLIKNEAQFRYRHYIVYYSFIECP